MAGGSKMPRGKSQIRNAKRQRKLNRSEDFNCPDTWLLELFWRLKIGVWDLLRSPPIADPVRR
jgi:hypothetical protein